jgi:hypothetical protein
MIDTDYKTDNCKNDHAKLEKKFPSHVHKASPPSVEEGKQKDLHFLGIKEANRHHFKATPTGISAKLYYITFL